MTDFVLRHPVGAVRYRMNEVVTEADAWRFVARALLHALDLDGER